MAKTHSKKRNAGLLREFLVRKISTSLVDGDQKTASRALKIVKRFFKPGTELHREFRLLNAMMKTTVNSEHVAANILSEAKRACRDHDVTRLEREKSSLIHAINHDLNDPTVFEQHVPDYRIYATVQTLLNDWRQPTPDIERVATYEDQVLHWLMSEKHQEPEVVLSEHDSRTSGAIARIMMKKLNDKYAGALLPEQRNLLRSYALSQASGDDSTVRTNVIAIKANLLETLTREKNRSNDYMTSRIDEAIQSIQQETLASIDDSTVTRFMVYAKLINELCSPVEGEDES